MGRQVDDTIFEDEEMGATLMSGDAGTLRRLIDERNATHGTWGFKLPEVHTHLRPEQLTLFDNAEVMPALRTAVSQLDEMLSYIGSLSAPQPAAQLREGAIAKATSTARGESTATGSTAWRTDACSAGVSLSDRMRRCSSSGSSTIDWSRHSGPMCFDRLS